MSDERYAVEVRMVIRAADKDEAGFAAVQVVAAAMQAGYKIESMFAVSVETLEDAARKARERREGDGGETPSEPESPKVEAGSDLFRAIMSGPTTDEPSADV